jgi:hypothetical protein
VIVWFNVFEKIALDPSLVPALYLWALEVKKKKTQEEVEWQFGSIFLKKKL